MDQDPPQPSASTPSSTMAQFPPHVHFLLCRQCKIRIALIKEFVFSSAVQDIMIDAGILKNVVNVDVAGPAHFRIDHGNTVADVNCHCCKTPFGWKYVVVPEETIILKTGSFLLHLNKLLMWDGKNMLYADTNEPVENA